jgi:hypothetical protein
MYQVPLVSADLTPAETVLQIADALDSLESIMTAVFDRVERRVQENGDRIRQIGGRMEAAAKKVRVIPHLICRPRLKNASFRWKF